MSTPISAIRAAATTQYGGFASGGVPIGLEPFANAQVEPCDVRLDRFEPAQLHPSGGSGDAPRGGRRAPGSDRALTAQSASGETGHRLGRGLARDRRRSIARPDTPKTSEATLASLMLAVFKELQQPVAFDRLALHEFTAVAQQLAQLPQRPRRREALGDQAMSNQIGDPFEILHIGLAPGHVADVPGVADDQLKCPSRMA